MTAKIKLNAASGGGSFSLQAPSSSSNNRVFTIPDVADGTIATTATAGKILQVVSTIDKAQSFSVTGSNTAEYAALNTTITPSSSSNKILIMVSIAFGASGTDDGQYGFRLYDGSSVITDAYNTNASSDGQSAFLSLDNQFDFIQTNFTYLYSPSTTSATTIKIYVKGDTNRTVYVNRWGTSASKGGVSTMTLLEVAP